jgi:hypothetical protein
MLTDADLPTLGWIHPSDVEYYRRTRSIVWLMAGPLVVEREPEPIVVQWVGLMKTGELIAMDGWRERVWPLKKGTSGIRVRETVECVERSGSTLRIRGVVESDLPTLILPYAFRDVSSAHPATAAAEAFGWPTR